MTKWKDIIGYEGIYKISETGRIKSLDRIKSHSNNRIHIYKSKLIKPFLKNGYPVVTLYNKIGGRQRSIHRLVAIHFIPNPQSLKVVNHKDGNKVNYTINNLEWCTTEHNELHAKINGLKYRGVGERNGNAKLTDRKVNEIRKFLEAKMNQREIAKAYGVSPATITLIKNSKLWKQLIL